MSPSDQPTLPPAANADDQATLPPELAGPVVGPTPAVAPGFEVLGELGRGGMGVVYRARQVKLNRSVALKVMLGGGHADSMERVRFLAEAEAVAAVDHPHVVRVFDFGQHAERPYLALEFCPGGSLAGRLRDDGPLAPITAAATVEKIARGVQAAHDQGIVHRDLKPANVLLDAAGEPKVTDFGLAKRGAGADLTRTGAIMGTPAYMAPEQAAGEGKSAGPAADVYALGVILFECLTGRPPFQSDDAIGLLLKVAAADAPSVRSLSAGVPADLDLICRKCLAKDPRDRYPTAAALADDLGRFARGEPVTVRPPTLAVVLRGWAKQNFGRFGLTFVVGAGFGLLTGLALWLLVLNQFAAKFRFAYDALPSARRPWLMATVPLPEAVRAAVGLIFLACLIPFGLLTARAVRTRSRDADLAAGLIAGAVAAVTCFTVSFGWMTTTMAVINPTTGDHLAVARAATADRPADRTRAMAALAERYPDLGNVPAERRPFVLHAKLLGDQMAGIPVGLWIGQLASLGLFVPVGVVSTVVGGRLLRGPHRWGRVAREYLEWIGPTFTLAGTVIG